MYPTTAELVEGSTVPELTGLTEEQQDVLRSSAIVAVENYTGQVFEPFEGVVTVRSDGGPVVPMPKRLEAVEVIGQNGVPLEDYTGVRIADGGATLYMKPPGIGYYEQALFDAAGGTRSYPSAWDAGLLDIDGTWGWTVCPPAVEVALRADMEEQAMADANALTATVGIARRLGVKQMAQGNLSFTLSGDGDGGGAAGFTLSDRVQLILQPYVWQNTGRIV